MTFAEVLDMLIKGYPIGRTSKSKAHNLCLNKDGLLARAGGGEVKLYDMDFLADDWVILDGPEGNIGTKYDIR